MAQIRNPAAKCVITDIRGAISPARDDAARRLPNQFEMLSRLRIADAVRQCTAP